MSNDAPLPDDGTSIDPRALELDRLGGASFRSLGFLVGFSRVPVFALSLFMTSANALPTEERVIECLILVGGFVGRAAPLEIVGSAVGIVGWIQFSGFSGQGRAGNEPELTSGAWRATVVDVVGGGRLQLQVFDRTRMAPMLYLQHVMGSNTTT